MAGFRGPSAGAPGVDLQNAPAGPVPFTSPFGLPVGRPQVWRMAGNEPGSGSGGVPGHPVQRAYGNPGVSTVQVYENKSPYGGLNERAFPGNRQGQGAWGYGQTAVVPGPNAYGSGQNSVTQAVELPQFGAPRPLQQMQESAKGAPGNAPVGYSNDKLVTYDRHGIMKVGYENSGRNSGQTDPPMDGPARPSLWLVQRTLNYQQGTDKSANTDDLDRDYSRNAQGMYVGEQGTGWSRVYGGVPGLWQEYGSYQGVSPSSAPVGPDTSVGIHSPTPQGQAGDGPHDVWSGPPHGLHSPTLPTYYQTLGRYMDIPQMVRPRIDRPSQSPIAGQSFSQTVQSQGQTGTNLGSSKAGVPVNTRFAPMGWRGRGR
jgi:hypothetical protein